MLDSANRRDSLVALGRIGAPHGLRGEVRFFPFAGMESSTLRPGLHVTLEFVEKGKTRHLVFLVQGVRRGKKSLLVKLETIEDRDGASKLTGATLFVRRADLPPLEEGEFYYVDVVGKEVRLENGSLVGVVKSIFRAAQDVLEIQTTEGVILVPVVEHLVPEIGPSGVVLTQEGLDLAVKE